MMGMPNDDEYLVDLLHSEIPTMFVDLRITGNKAGYVISNNQAGAEQAMNYLIELGHRRIGTIIGQEITKAAQERLQGYVNILEKYNIPFDPELVRHGSFDQNQGRIAFRQLMELPEPPTAIFSQSDSMAIGALEMAKEMGIRIPEDVSIIGFDDIEVASYVTPGLTTIRQDKVRMGELAAEALVQMILHDSKGPLEYMVETELVIRDSCAPFLAR